MTGGRRPVAAARPGMAAPPAAEAGAVRHGRHGAVGALALSLLLSAACTVTRPTDNALMDNLAEMQIRMRLLQSEIDGLRDTLDAREADQTQRSASDEMLYARLDEVQARLATLPEEIAERCPNALGEPAAAAAACTTVQRVVVSGDKLVVGQIERVWLEQPSLSVVAAIDAGADSSILRAIEVVEFERDGKKWVRFDMPAAEQPVTVERPLQRTARANGDNGPRLPVVDLRVQLGDVRETVEFAVVKQEADDTEQEDGEPLMTLGRNFLTDVALVDVARNYIQPTFIPPAD